MFKLNFIGNTLKGFSLFRFLFPRKVTYSLGYKPFEVQETSTYVLIRTVLK